MDIVFYINVIAHLSSPPMQSTLAYPMYLYAQLFSIFFLFSIKGTKDFGDYVEKEIEWVYL